MRRERRGAGAEQFEDLIGHRFALTVTAAGAVPSACRNRARTASSSSPDMASRRTKADFNRACPVDGGGASS
ncbi:hypothetical protein [Streptomyces cirratus]|uniref:hypothetical protein n=1 Tax=Streptomyces cirratus TaxID=68187 RepID=UPI0036198EB1